MPIFRTSICLFYSLFRAQSDQQLFRLIVAWCDFCKLLQQGAFLQLFLSFRKLGYFTLINLNFLLQPPDI